MRLLGCAFKRIEMNGTTGTTHTIGELRDFCSFIINNCISEHMLDEHVNCFES